MSLLFEDYQTQKNRWPREGRHIMAQFDDESIVVYQAYRPEIGHFAAEKGYFGGAFSLNRMSWIKPNFLWMMYRSGWASKNGQEVVLGIRLKRSAFDDILSQAVHSTYVEACYGTREAWKERLSRSSVRLQWDPDHDPSGAKQTRRAIQLGLKGKILLSYSRDWILGIEDISERVRDLAQRKSKRLNLEIPKEEPYLVSDDRVSAHLGLTKAEAVISENKE